MQKDRTVFIDVSIKTLRLVGKPLFYLIVFKLSLFSSITFSLRRIKPTIFPAFKKLIYLILKAISLPKIINTSSSNSKLKEVILYPPPKHIKIHAYKLVVGSFVFGLCLTSTYYIYHNLLKDLPHPTALKTRHLPQTTKIYDRNHHLLYKVYQDQNRTPITLDQVPVVVINATIAIEDSDYFSHPGFSVRGLVRAIKTNLTEHQQQGGSTITQQLIKNALLSSEKTYTRKLKEFILSLLVETYYTKDEILTMYFNEVNYGGTTYGIEEASQFYFDRSASELNLSQASLLAGLPSSPTTYSPFGAKPELAKQRQLQVLNRMVEEFYITPEQAKIAAREPLKFRQPTANILAPHFVMYVKDLLVKQYGEAVVNQGGLEVITTLDLNLQKHLESVIDQELTTLTKLKVSNAAGLILNPKTGEILAMVGSKNYFDTQSEGQVNLVLSQRQPGSAIKPLNYALAFENGFSPSSIILDAPISYQIAGSPTYTPKNYDNRFHGPVTLRQALANSYNIPAIKILNQLGVSNFVKFGQKLGITTWDQSYYGLSITLGAAEVTMLDLTHAYSVFANAGKQVDINPFIKITQTDSVLLENHCLNPNNQLCSSKQLITPFTAFQISNILSDNNARASAFGSHSVLNIPNHQVAVKTGTSNNLRDNWTIGYTPSILVATWVGNFDNTPMSQIASGITGASPIWNKIITPLIKDSDDTFNPPTGMIALKICRQGTSIICGECANPQEEYFLSGTKLSDICHQPRAETTTTTNKRSKIKRELRI